MFDVYKYAFRMIDRFRKDSNRILNLCLLTDENEIVSIKDENGYDGIYKAELNLPLYIIKSVTRPSELKDLVDESELYSSLDCFLSLDCDYGIFIDSPLEEDAVKYVSYNIVSYLGHNVPNIYDMDINIRMFKHNRIHFKDLDDNLKYKLESGLSGIEIDSCYITSLLHSGLTNLRIYDLTFLIHEGKDFSYALQLSQSKNVFSAESLSYTVFKIYGSDFKEMHEYVRTLKQRGIRQKVNICIDDMVLTRMSDEDIFECESLFSVASGFLNSNGISDVDRLDLDYEEDWMNVEDEFTERDYNTYGRHSEYDYYGDGDHCSTYYY